ncbi:amino acid ABC transporter permease [Methylobacterium currus]|uniref:Amino acid ABC transporter permease n=1 Tax=Methylobacterium currus TaxID=2051553 RepID=A0A2R4WWD8_9HYPH|nr:amino acid ABC transporter permease [Methylobacterium currus]AWB25868.1 amino acid ABC transporter permease [Methylobacterium currus]UHC19508.1 amino acid ABC transporter permease [Methylobacterium currus]
MSLDYAFDFEAVAAHADLLAAGAWTTALVTLVCCCGGFAIAVACNALRHGGRAPLRLAIGLYVDAVRNTPFLVQLFCLYFGVSSLGWRIDAPLTACCALSLYSGAYQTEILRGALDGLPRAQQEAGEALGLSDRQVFLRLLLPQAVEVALPALKSQLVLTLMATSIVSVISVHELSHASAEISTETYRSFEAYLTASAIYLAMVIALRMSLSLIAAGLFLRSRRRVAGGLRAAAEILVRRKGSLPA